MRAALVAAALAAIVWLTGLAHDSAVQRRERFPDDVDVLYVPPPGYLDAMSLGYREALADLIWVRALVFSGQKLQETDVASVGRYVSAITGLAPRFHRVYLWGGVTPVYAGAEINREVVDQAITTYERGAQQFPESHEILYPLGMLLTHQVGSTPGYTDAERAAFEELGVDYIRRAAAFGADPLVRQYAATLVSEHASGRLATQFLETQLAQAQDEGYRRMLRKKLAELGGQQSVEEIEAVRAGFFEESKARAPYLPDTLYAVIRDEHAQEVTTSQP